MATSRFCAAGCLPGAAASTRALAAARAEGGEAVGAGADSLRFSGGEREEYTLPAAVIATGLDPSSEEVRHNLVDGGHHIGIIRQGTGKRQAASRLRGTAMSHQLTRIHQ